jgi:hypothetical protein
MQNGIFPRVIITQTIFNLNNYGNPLKFQAMYIFSSLSFKSHSSNHVFFSDHVEETDEGVLYSSVPSQVLTGYGRTQNYFFNYNETVFFARYNFEIFYENAYFLWMRQYMINQDLLGNIDCFMKMIAF